jgi:hypothetical protein
VLGRSAPCSRVARAGASCPDLQVARLGAGAGIVAKAGPQPLPRPVAEFVADKRQRFPQRLAAHTKSVPKRERGPHGPLAEGLLEPTEEGGVPLRPAAGRGGRRGRRILPPHAQTPELARRFRARAGVPAGRRRRRTPELARGLHSWARGAANQCRRRAPACRRDRGQHTEPHDDACGVPARKTFHAPPNADRMTAAI